MCQSDRQVENYYMQEDHIIDPVQSSKDMKKNMQVLQG